MEPERRQVTILFADMVDFTAFSERSGEEAAFTLMQSLAKLMGDAVRDHGGVVQNFTGDGVMAVFGAPVADEDGPLQACRAALAILERLKVAADHLAASHGLRPQLRIGINSGPAVFGKVQGEDADANVTVLGDTVNVAARLQAFAPPGSAVLTEATNRLVQGAVATRFFGEHSIKGKSEAQKVFRLDSFIAGATRFDAKVHRGLTTYVGRDRELERLESALDGIAGGLKAFDIVGEPGIGKSRLLHEFREQIVHDNARILTVNCTPDGRQTPFLAFIEIVRGAFRLESGDKESVLAHKLDNGLKGLGLGSAENLELMLNLLGLRPAEGVLQTLDGVLIGLRTRELLRRVVQAESRLTTLILVFEDVHWLDGASEELLANIIASEEAIRLLILHTRRPGYDPPWFGQKRVVHLPLLPLSARETTRIAQARIGGGTLPESLAKLISSKADGNALFAEEIANFLIERRIVLRSPSGLEFDPRGVSAALPESIQSLLASRVDRLAPVDRTLLQAAAVVGRRFDPDLVTSLGVTAKAGEAPFATMEALDLVNFDESSGEYVFKHALIRDAIYDGLLSKSRAELHLSVAEALERRHGNRLTEIAEALAYHYGATTRFEKAFAYLALAGDKSLNVYAVPEAERYFRQALEIFEKHEACAEPSRVARLLVRMLETLLLKCDYRDAGQIARKHMPFIKAAGETPDLVTACYYQALSLVQSYELRAAHELMIDALAIAERLGDGRARAYARGGLLQCRTRLGLDTLEAAEKMKAELLDDSLRYGDNFIRNASYFFVIWDYLYRGLIKEAREVVTRLIASGDERNDPRALGFAHWIQGWITLICGAPEASLKHADDSMRVAVVPMDRLQGATIKATARIFMGETDEGLAELVALNAEFERLGALYSITEMPRGYALISLGQVTAGIAIVRRTIRERDAAGDRNLGNFARVVLAEIYIQILTGGRKVPFGVIARNIRTLADAKIFGARRARRLLEEAASLKQWSENGLYVARVNFALGQLAALRKRRGNARELFERARLGAASQGEDLLLRRIEGAVAGLG